MKKNIIILIACIINAPVWGQIPKEPVSNTNTVYEQGQEYMDVLKTHYNQFPQSPQAASLYRYSDYPVDLSVGIPEITIPIYTIQSGKLSVPITLSYHLGGIRVSDFATTVGLGWMLNAGGAISRTVKGMPDEHGVSGFLTNKGWHLYNGSQSIFKTVPWNATDFGNIPATPTTENGREALYNYLDYLSRPNNNTLEGSGLDGMSDHYSYQAPGISGSFVFDINRNIVNIPDSDNKITRNQPYFRITDNYGNTYNFNELEDTNITEDNSYSYTGAWNLSSIVSPDGVDVMTFEYIDAVFRVDSNIATESEGAYLTSSGGMTVIGAYRHDKPSAPSTSTVITTQKLISRITFRGGNIEFNYTERSDNGQYKLSSVIIKDQSGSQVRKVEFDYDYFVSSGSYTGSNAWKKYRLKLTGIRIYGSSPNICERYSFEYDNTGLPPYDRANGFCGQDYWGFYNGQNNSGGDGAVPNMIVGPAKNMQGVTNTFRADRESNASAMKACVLTRINYPTGGYTVFETEANRDAANKVVGGLRIKKITSYSAVNQTAYVKRYEYDNPVYLFEPTPNKYKYDMYYALDVYDSANRAQRIYYTEEPVVNFKIYKGSPVMYKKVISYDSDNAGANNMKVTTYADPNFRNPGGIYPAMEPLTWTCGRVSKEEFYGTGSANPIKQIKYAYSENYKINNIGFSARNSLTHGNSIIQATFPRYNIKDAFVYGWVNVVSGYSRLTRKEEYTYDPSQGTYIATTEAYEYAGDLIIGKSMSASEDSVTFQKRYTYPHTVFSPTGVIVSMKNKNMYAYPVEIITEAHKRYDFISTTPLSTTKVHYMTFGNGIYPSAVQTAYNGSTQFITEITNDSYDSYGNIRQVTAKDGSATTYIWGYEGRYLIAEIKNATFGRVCQVINNSTINSITSKAEPTNSDWNQIHSLRNLPEVHVTIYKYKNLIGVTEITDPSGRKTTYGYDSHGRLAEVRDEDGNLLEKYEYNYASGQ